MNGWDDDRDVDELFPLGRPDRVLREDAPTARQAHPVVDAAVSAVVLTMTVLAAFGAYFGVVIGQMAFAGCAETSAPCGYAAGTAVMIGHPVLTAAVVVIGVSRVFVRRSRGRAGWPAAVGTLGAVLLLFAVAVVVTDVATQGRLLGAS